MTNIPAFCKLLANPLRQEILLRVYGARDGMNVGTLADEMLLSGIKVSGISQYLGQLERLGVIRRYRAGKYVNYVADATRATPAVQEAVGIVVRRLRKHDDLTPLFKVLMNPFRAQVVSVLSKVGALPAAEICEKTDHNVKVLKRDLQPAVDAGLLTPDDSDIPAATYHYIPPTDPANSRAHPNSALSVTLFIKCVNVLHDAHCRDVIPLINPSPFAPASHALITLV